MSATDDHDGEEVLHQAPWVYFVTYGACLGFLALLMAAKGLFVAAASILWFTIVSIPLQTNFAKQQFAIAFVWLLAAPVGFFGIKFLLG